MTNPRVPRARGRPCGDDAGGSCRPIGSGAAILSTEQNRAIIQRFFDEAVNGGNDAVIDALFTDACALYMPGQPPVYGPEGIRQTLSAYRAAFPDLHSTVEDIAAEGDLVYARIVSRGTHQGELLGIAPTGKAATWTAMVMYRIGDGKAVESRVEIDTLGLLQQVGAVPASAATA